MDHRHDPHAERGAAWTAAEREAHGLAGRLPARVETLAEQSARMWAAVEARPNPFERYLFLSALQDDNPTLFYRVVLDHLEQALPLIYTPVVGEACLQWSRVFTRPRGLYLTPADRGRMRELLGQWPQRDVRIIVVTDGSRILGLGDLGANGMGIPVGKLALYSACGGIHPAACLPVTLDFGCDNPAVRDDPFYLGLRAPRVQGADYDALVEEFVHAACDAFPGVLIQFEDFSNVHAFPLLDRWRNEICCFNDDIQGTGAMGLAAILAARPLTGLSPAAHRILFVGAGEAAMGIAEIGARCMVSGGLDEAAAKDRCWFFNSHGLVVAERAALQPHKRPWVHEHAPVAELLAAVEEVRPTALIGVSGKGGLFTPQVLQAMARINERPLIFALSNPTSRSECTAEEAYRWTDGRAVFASGSPFPPVEFGGRTLTPAQGNNCFIFPGMGLGVLASGARRVSDNMFLAAATALAAQAGEDDLSRGRVLPSTARLREVAVAVACAVAEAAWAEALASMPRPADVAAHVRAAMYEPRYGRWGSGGPADAGSRLKPLLRRGGDHLL